MRENVFTQLFGVGRAHSETGLLPVIFVPCEFGDTPTLEPGALMMTYVVIYRLEHRVAYKTFVIHSDGRQDGRATVARGLCMYLMCDQGVHRVKLLAAPFQPAYEHQFIVI
eukprot:2599037-Pyramimonas_sp.AAC.1